LLCRKDTREHLSTYVEASWSKLDRKSVEPIALARVSRLGRWQQFLNSLEWDQEAVDRHAAMAPLRRDHTSAHRESD